MRPRITQLLALVSCFSVAGTARADNVFDAFGQPGTTDWDTACAAVPSGVTFEPWIDDPSFECSVGDPDCMQRVDIETSDFPNAVCNDGSPGAFYIHAGPVGETRWVIHLQGGGGCQTYDECLARWCGENFIYTASMMSTDWNADGTPDIPDNIALGGMRLQAAANDFADYNHVFVYYCSSDGWLGTEDDVTFDNGVASMEMDVRGHSILLAVRHMLRRTGAGTTWFAVDGMSTLPDLDLATEILFTGTSAGGLGAVQNVDWFLTPLAGIDSALVFDAALEPTDDELTAMNVWIDTDANGTGDVDAATHRTDDLLAKWSPGGYFASIDAFVDESCRAEYEPTGEIDRCTITSELLAADVLGAPAITTDTFVRMDLGDPVISGSWLDGTAVIGSGGTTPLTIANYRTMIRGTMLDLYNAADVVTGAFGPRCDRHVGLEDTNAMGNDVTPNYRGILFPIGPGVPMHDALSAWWNGGALTPTRYIDRAQSTALSTCI